MVQRSELMELRMPAPRRAPEDFDGRERGNDEGLRAHVGPDLQCG